MLWGKTNTILQLSLQVINK